MNEQYLEDDKEVCLVTNSKKIIQAFGIVFEDLWDDSIDIKDLIVDRSAFEKIQVAGGFISTNTGSAPDSHAIPVEKEKSDLAFDASVCIGCGACVAACKNASAMLFVAARVSQFALFPQGRIEANNRVKSMVIKMDELGFGNCTNTGACEAECPKKISMTYIARLNREYFTAKLK